MLKFMIMKIEKGKCYKLRCGDVVLIEEVDTRKKKINDAFAVKGKFVKFFGDNVESDNACVNEKIYDCCLDGSWISYKKKHPLDIVSEYIKDFVDMLPDGMYFKILKNIAKHHKMTMEEAEEWVNDSLKCVEFSDIISMGFVWKDSEEGHPFWSDFYDKLEKEERLKKV
ncbi:MAG: hypothetical protein MdMp024_1770 [Bacteroidales bacterium]